MLLACSSFVRGSDSRSVEFGAPTPRGHHNGATDEELPYRSGLGLGLVLSDPEEIYGQGKVGPRALREAAPDAIRRDLKPKYGDLTMQVIGLKRLVRVRFKDPEATDLPDFTADAIVALDNPARDVLYIPRFQSWDRSHSEEHTRLVVAANRATNTTFAGVVRRVKHWNRRPGRVRTSHDQDTFPAHRNSRAAAGLHGRRDFSGFGRAAVALWDIGLRRKSQLRILGLNRAGSRTPDSSARR